VGVQLAKGPGRPGSEALRLAVTLRDQVLRDASRALAAAIARQSAAQDALDCAARELIERREAATRSANDAAVDDYAAWLPAGRRALGQAASRLAHEALAAASTRAAVKLAKAALRERP
jgi:hypothetical protein